MQSVCQIGLIEVDQIEFSGLIGYGELGEAQTFADLCCVRTADDHGLETGRYIGLQLVNGGDFGAILVVSGKVGKQIINRLDAQLLQLFGTGCSDALQGSDRGIQIHGTHLLFGYYNGFFSPGQVESRQLYQKQK